MCPTVIAPKKSLGQHFLHDANIARKIVGLLDVQPGETVLEIGPGEGVLTALLAATGARVIALDIDRRSVALLHERIRREGWTNVQALHGDILGFDLAACAREAGAPLRVIGNLPYYITSQILFRLYDAPGAVRDCVVMMQREVADRITSPPGTKEYGILSVVTAVHASVAASFLVSPNVFTPKPRVWSRVLHLVMRDDVLPRIGAYRAFRSTVRATFGMRRKTLLNSLRHAGIDTAALAHDAVAAAMLARRPESLTPGEFIALADAVARVSPEAFARGGRAQTDDDTQADGDTQADSDAQADGDTQAAGDMPHVRDASGADAEDAA